MEILFIFGPLDGQCRPDPGKPTIDVEPDPHSRHRRFYQRHIFRRWGDPIECYVWYENTTADAESRLDALIAIDGFDREELGDHWDEVAGEWSTKPGTPPDPT